MSSGSSGVEKATVRAARSSRFCVSAWCSSAAQAIAGRGLAARPGDQGIDSLHGARGLLAEHPEHVGGLRQEPIPPELQIALQITSIIAPSTAEPGSVKSQAKPIERTTRQRT